MTFDTLEKSYRKYLKSGTAAFALLAMLAASPVAQAQKIEEISGTLPDGTAWLISVPTDWNGVLLRDLDYAANSQTERFTDLLSRGYAFAGLARHPMRTWQYDPQREIHNLEAVQTIFEEQYDPEWVLAFGCSGAGFVSLAAAEDFSDRIDGAVVLAAHIPVWIMNSYLDGWFAMQTLLADAYEEAGLGSASDLSIVNMPNGAGSDVRTIGDIQASWRSAVETLGETPEGRARLALAFAIGQWSPWEAADQPFPDPLTSEALADQLVPSALRLTGTVGGQSRVMFENAASGQQLSGNEGIDYAAFYDTASPIMKELVEHLYAEAGLDIGEDIERINSAPRIAASDYALDYWSQPGRTADGDLQVPTIRVHSLGDNSIPYSLMQGYQALVEEKGTTDLYRQSLLKFTDHCGFEASETTALVEVMMERLETGEWPDTSPEALNAVAAELDLGEARFMEEDGWRVEEYNRTWIAGE